MPDFPWAEGRKAEVFILPLVLIGDILSPGGSVVGRFTESSGIAPMVFGTDSVFFEALKNGKTTATSPGIALRVPRPAAFDNSLS